MLNQTFDRSHQPIPRHTSEPTAALHRGAAIAQSLILRSAWPLVLLLALGLSSLAFFSAPNIIGLFHDDGIYTVVAKALSEGDGYRIISLPGEPYQTKYPFLYSYLLSWAWSLNPQFPDNISLLNFVTVFSYFASLLLAYVFYRTEHRGRKGGCPSLCFFGRGERVCFFLDQLSVERHSVHGGRAVLFGLVQFQRTAFPLGPDRLCFWQPAPAALFYFVAPARH